MLIGPGSFIKAGVTVVKPLPAPYSAITSSSSVNEGSTITFTSTSTGVPDGTLYWSRYGGAANDADFSAVNGSFTVTNGVGTFTVTPITDRLTEGTELFSVVVRTGSITGPIIGTSAGKEILDTSLDPTYLLETAGSVSSIDEGTALTFNVTTTEVDDGTTLYWFVGSTGSYSLSAGRFSPGAGGSFTVNSNAGTFTVTISADLFTATGTQSYNIFLSTTSPAPTGVGNTLSITVNDTSQTPTYEVTAVGGAASVNEGSAFTFDVTTTNVADGTTLYWTIGHLNTNSADFSATSGTVTINSNTGSFTVTSLADTTTEGAETFVVRIRTVSTSGTIVATSSTKTINDTSMSPPVRGSAVFNRANTDFMSVAAGSHFNLGTTWTIEFSIYMNGPSADIGGSGIQGIIDQGGWYYGLPNNSMLVGLAGGQLTVCQGTSTSAIQWAEPTPQQWVHVAIVNDSGTQRAYYNGIEQIKVGDNGQNGNYTNIELPLYVGSLAPAYGSPLSGKLTNLRITNTAVYGKSWVFGTDFAFGQIKLTGDGAGNTYLMIVQPANAMTDLLSVGDIITIDTGTIYTTTIAAVLGIVPNDPYIGSYPNSRGYRLANNLGITGQPDINVGVVTQKSFVPKILPTKITGTKLLWTPTDQALTTDTSDSAALMTNPNNIVTYSSSYPATNNTRGSAVFDGSTNRYYKVPGGSHLQLGTTWTIEWWQKTTAATAGNGNLYTIMSQAPDGGRIDIYYQSGNLVVQNGQTLCAEPAINVWVHVAIVNNAGVGTVYYDGVAQGATGNFGNYGQTQDLYIGKRGNNTFQYFNGKLTNIRITDTAVYTSNFVTDQLPTVVASHTKLLLRPTVDTIYGVDEGNLALAISSSGATYSSDYAPVTNTYTARTYNENDQYAGGYSGNAIKVYIPDYPDILNVPNGATVILTGQTSGTFTVGSGLPFSQATTTLTVRNLVLGLGISVYGGDNLTFTWRT